MVQYLSVEIQKRYQKLTFTNAILVAAESLLGPSGLSDDIKDRALDPHYKKLTEEFIAEINELQALELYKAYYAGRLLENFNTETAIPN